jgi:hypothetical protein
MIKEELIKIIVEDGKVIDIVGLHSDYTVEVEYR